MDFRSALKSRNLPIALLQLLLKKLVRIHAERAEPKRWWARVKRARLSKEKNWGDWIWKNGNRCVTLGFLCALCVLRVKNVSNCKQITSRQLFWHGLNFSRRARGAAETGWSWVKRAIENKKKELENWIGKMGIDA